MVKVNPGNILLAVVSVAVTLTGTEFALRLFPHPTGHFVVVPGTHWTVTAAPALVPGITGINHYDTNEWGIRGRPFGRDGTEYRVITVGGSTTENAALDDSEAWPHLLEAALSRTADGRAVWVGNVGRSGMTTRDNALHVKYLVRELPHMDALVALVGANDFQLALQPGFGYRRPRPITDSTEELARMPRSFSYVAGRAEQGAMGVSPFKATELWQLVRRARNVWIATRSFDLARAGTNQFVVTRAQRQAARRWVDSLPPLADALAEYRGNLNAMVDHAAAAGARMVFVTQPTLWGSGLPDSIDRRLAFGWFGTDPKNPDGYFTAGAMGRGMTAFIAELLRVCRERNVECIDLAASVSHDTTAMYDDMHFTERGSALVAEQLAQYLRQRPPFQEAGSQLPSRPVFPSMKRSRPQPSP